MHNNPQKIIFLGIVVGVIVIFAAMHEGLFVSGASTADAGSGSGNTSGTINNPPLLVLPSLSADIGATAAATQTTDQNSTPAPTNATSATPFLRIANTPIPDIGSEAAFIADLQTGTPFLDMNASERWPMASISKLMTAVVATNLLSSNERITITASMVAVDPTEQILHVGDTYTVADLMYVMLLPSNNVAAEAFAEFYGRARFLAAMNAQAQAWGMTDTYYDDPSGLSAANESSGDDLLKLAQNIYTNYPQILAITRTPQITVQNLATNQPVIIKSINDFAGTADFIGGKTGYTDQADGNLLSIFSYEGRPIFIVVEGIDDGVRFDGTQALYNWFKTNFK